jgi:protein-arginine kinase activator protein McsA
MFEKLELKEMPKCQDGRICKNQKDGFMLATFEHGQKFVCWECYQEARNELILLLEKVKENK